MEQWGHCWIHTCTIPKKAKANVFKIYLLAIATKGWSPKGWRGKENTLPMKQWVGFENGTFGPQSNALQCHSEFQEYHKHYCSQRFSTILHAEGTKNSDDYHCQIHEVVYQYTITINCPWHHGELQIVMRRDHSCMNKRTKAHHFSSVAEARPLGGLICNSLPWNIRQCSPLNRSHETDQFRMDIIPGIKITKLG